MCGRYNVTDDAAIQALLASLGIPLRINSQYNLAPTDTVPVIVQGQQGAELHAMRWWLTPSWAPEISNKYSMFNARAENLPSSRAFKGPYHHRRGIMPASSFIEWCKEGKENKPYLITADGGFLFAALWDVWEKQGSYLESCTIITTTAPPGFSWLHHRIPLLISEEEIQRWLNPAASMPEIEKIRGKKLSGQFTLYTLPNEVNNSRIKSQSYFQDLQDPMEIKV